MKNKLLATIVTLVLLISVFGIAFNFKPAVADAMYHLDVYTDPGWLMTYAQINGTGDYTDKTVVQLTAPDPVYTTTGERWIFQNWWFNKTIHVTGSPHATVTMNGNCNMTAKYKVQYLFTVTVPSNPNWEKNFTAHIWDVAAAKAYTNNNESISMWFYNNTQVQAGVTGQFLWRGTPSVYGEHRNEIARFLNWTDVGYYVSDPYAWSKPITITGPTAPVMEWAMYYMLYVDSTYATPVEGKQGWYKECTNVTLSETLVYQWSTMRYVPDYWEVDETKVDEAGTPPCVIYVNYTGEEQDAKALWNRTITVHMDTNHTAVLHYKTQYYLTFTDGGCPTGASGVSGYNGYYYKYKNYTFTAPQYTNQTTCNRYRFNRWYGYQWPPGWFGNLTDRGFTVNVTGPMKFYAEYKLQFYVQLFTDPVGLLADGINLTLTGWTGDAGWFDVNDRAYLYAPEYFGEEEWNNDTRYQWKGWYYGTTVYAWANETSWPVTSCRNFTATYTKEYAVVVSADPADAGKAFEGTYWKTADGSQYICWATPPTWTDPKGWTYVFDHWETSPYDNLNGPKYRKLSLDMNTSYTAIAHYVLVTTLVVDQDKYEFESAGNAYCHTFPVTIYATNVEMLYALDFHLEFDTTVVELVDVDTSPLAGIWPDGYFVVPDTDLTDGDFNFVATAVGNDTKGFNGTGALVVLTFHIIYEPCVSDKVTVLDIRMHTAFLMHKDGTEITWDNTKILDGQLIIKALKPVLKMYPYILDNGKTVSVDIYVINATKLHDFQFYIDYNKDQLQVAGITLWTCFLPGPYDVRSIWYDDTTGRMRLYAREEAGAPLANGTGILATITFDVIVSGTCLDAITWDKTNTYLSEKCDLGTVYLYDKSSVTSPSYDFLDAWDGVMPTPIKGDVNLDGVVDIYDLRLVASYYGTTGILNDSMLNDDDKIDIYDLIIVAVNFGNGA